MLRGMNSEMNKRHRRPHRPTTNHHLPGRVCGSAINTGHDTDKSFFITTKHAALDGEGQPMAMGLSRDSEGREGKVLTLVLVVKPRSVIEACYLDVTEGQACGEEELDLFSDIKSVESHPNPSAWEPARAYPFPLGGDSGSSFLCSQARWLKATLLFVGRFSCQWCSSAAGQEDAEVGVGLLQRMINSPTQYSLHIGCLF